MRSYAWHGRFILCDFPGAPLDVADSWRHSSGRANRLDLHIQRFERSAGPLPAGFVEQMLGLLEEGELFPRISLTQGLLLLDVRPAPPARPTTKLTYVDTVDPRTQPLVKGPDLGVLRAFRNNHLLDGTDDVVIVDGAGAMLETTTGALVAWEGDTLLIPEGVWLPSVTLHQVIERAQELGLRGERRRFTLEFVAGRPLWFLNSLHGISPVEEVRGLDFALTPPPHPDAVSWREWWWAGFS